MVKEIEDRNSFYRSVVSRAATIIVILTEECEILEFNEYAEKIYGISRQEVIGKKYCNLFVSKRFRGEFLENIRKASNGESISGYESVVKSHDGKKRVLSGSFSSAVSSDENAGAVIYLAQDITEHKELEEALLRSEHEFRSIFNSVRDPIILVDFTGKILRINKAALDISEYEEDHFLGKRFQFLTIFPPSSLALMTTNFLRLLSNQEIFPYEVEMYTRHGKKKYMRVHSSILGKRDKRSGVITIMTDLTARIAAEKALKVSEEKYKTLFDYANDALFILDFSERAGARFIDCNDRTLKVFGCTSRDQILGKTPEDFSPAIQPDGQPSSEKIHNLSKKVLAGDPQCFEWAHYKLDGTPFWVEVTYNRIDIKDEILMQAVVRDITAHKKMEEERVKHLKELEVFYEAAVLREDRILELKKEVQELKHKVEKFESEEK